MKISNFISAQDLQDIKKSGVYKISYGGSNRVYIGSTCDSFYNRWIGHIWDFKNGCHKNQKLSNVVNKYGLQSLDFEILEVINDKSKVLEREQYFIDLYDSYNSGLNCTPLAINSLGCKRSEKTLVNHFYHPVSQYTKDGDYIATFKSMKHAARETGTNHATLCNSCKRKVNSANGFQWREGSDIKNIGQSKIQGTESVYQYDLEGNFVKEWYSLKEVAAHFNKPSNVVGYAIRNKIILDNSYWSKYKENLFEIPTKVVPKGFIVQQITTEGMIVKEWPSVRTIARELKIPISTIRNVIQKGNCHRGYLWKVKK